MRSRNICGEVISGRLHLPDHIGGDDVGIFKLLIEVPRDQLDRVFQLALAVGERSLAKFADGHGGHGEDPGDQQHAQEVSHSTGPRRDGRSQPCSRPRIPAAIPEKTWRIPLPGGTGILRTDGAKLRKASY